MPEHPAQTTIPNAPPFDPYADGANVTAHMPPQPHGPILDTMFGLVWNPRTNEWAPSDEPHGTFGHEGPSHGDEPYARPMVNAPGVPLSYTEGGGAPDERANLLTDVRRGTPAWNPVQEVHHKIETIDTGSDRVRGRVVRVELPAVGGTLQNTTVLLEENPNRVRALLKCITTNGIIILFPIRQGGAPPFVGVPSGNIAGFPLATGDPVHEVKATAGVEAIVANTGAQAFCDVAIWEEMDNPASEDPGLGT